MKGFSVLLVVLFVGFAASACEHADPLSAGNVPTGEEVSFATIQTSIFDTSCALSGCHAGTFPPQGLNLSAGEAYGNLVGVTAQEDPDLLRVDPGDAQASYLYLKINGASTIRGDRMPLGRTPLSDAQITMIEDWINQGAENN